MKRNAARAEFVRKVAAGAVIGAAAIAPGLNGGVLASAAGIYEPAVRAIVNIRKEFRKSFAELLPIGIGAAAGFFLFAVALQGIMERSRVTVIYAFTGLVAGSIPAFISEANARGFRKRYLVGTAAACAAVVVLGILGANAPGRTAGGELGIPVAALCGAILAVGTVVPGISASFVFLYMGVFDKLLAALSGFDLRVLLPLAAAFLLTAAALLKLAEALFRRYHGAAYYAVLGILIGSMAIAFPGVRPFPGIALDVAIFAACAVLSFFLMILQKRFRS